jgi:hypothetical protein
MIFCTHIDGTIPMLGSGTLHKPSGSLDRRHGALLWQNEFLELRTKVRGPSVGCVDDCSGSHFAARSGDSDPAIAVFVRNVQDGSIGLKVQIAFLEELSQECMDEFVRPSVRSRQARISKKFRTEVTVRRVVADGERGLTSAQQDAQQQPSRPSSAKTPPPRPHPQ